MQQLAATSGNGVQSTTQSPQASGQDNLAGANSSSVQPTTSFNLLNSSNGIALHPDSLASVGLNTSSADKTANTQATQKHHVNGALLGIVIVLVVVAIGLFWLMGNSINTTTD
jgi:hypothetical protein